MQNNNTKLEMIIDQSKKIISSLNDKTNLSDLLLIMNQRDELILDLMEQSSGADQRDMINKVLQLRDQEYIALLPYRQEFEDLKKVLVKLNHHKHYIATDANDVV